MTLTPGTRLGPYEVVSPLGAGGMGEVYRARDTRLGRDVAVKVLPRHLSSNEDVRARFEREAKTVSSLNHPHICTLFDVGREGDTDYLVMELVDGETLAQRLGRGALPMAEVLRLGAQIADALDRAHRAGVIHRDLKPGNVMLTKTGGGPVTAKLMDFGLARATGMSGAAGLVDPQTNAETRSASVVHSLTAAGTIVGTLRYMAPEQLLGRKADSRSDIWALGCVLYEMATRNRAFEGSNSASLIAGILEREPLPIGTFAPLAPPAFERVVKQCLAKDPDERWQTAADLRRELLWIHDSDPYGRATSQGLVGRRGRGRRGLLATLAVVVLAAVTVVLAYRYRPPEPVVGVVRFSIVGPENMALGRPANSVISPNGRMLALAVRDTAGTSRLWMRPLESMSGRELPGTEGAFLPFWSPDSRSIAFFADGKLKRVSVDGGRPQVLCDAKDARGGSWSREGVIIFSPSVETPLSRVPAGGGVVTPVTVLDSASREIAHRWPHFLPDGRHFLYTTLPARDGQYETFLCSLDGQSARLVARADRAAVYAPQGYLLLERNETLYAQEFDVRTGTVRGELIAVDEVPDAGGHLGEPNASVSDNGVLIYKSIHRQATRLAWMDRSGGDVEAVPMTPGNFVYFTPSPDGRQAVLVRRDPLTAMDLWLVDLERGATTRFTSESGNEGLYPTWSPDGHRIAFASNRNGHYDIFARPVMSGAREEVLLASDQMKKWPTSWAPDGHSIVFIGSTPLTGDDIWVLSLGGDRKPVPYLNSRFNETNGAISSDGRWLAFTSDESGRSEVYVQPFPTPGTRTRISVEGGDQPYWSRDGRELCYMTADGGQMACDIQAGPEFRPSAPRLLFRIPSQVVHHAFAGDRVLCLLPVGAPRPSTITVALNWSAALERT